MKNINRSDLFFKIMHGQRFELIPEWIEKYPEEINGSSTGVRKQWTVLHMLAQAEAAGVEVGGYVVQLLAAGADPHQEGLPAKKGQRGDTPFNIAAPNSPMTGRLMTNHWLESALAIEDAKEREEALNYISGSHRSSLMQYIGKWSHDDEIAEQTARGFNAGMILNWQNDSDWTPLHAAAPTGRVKATELLITYYNMLYPDAIEARTKEAYTANYNGRIVEYPANATARELVEARLELDEKIPDELRRELEQNLEALKKPSPTAGLAYNLE